MKKYTIISLVTLAVATCLYLNLNQDEPYKWDTNDIKAHWSSETPPETWISSKQTNFTEIEKRIETEYLDRVQHNPEIAARLKEAQLNLLKEMKERFGEDTEIKCFEGPGKYRGIEGYVFYIDSKPIDAFIPHGFVFTHMEDGTLLING